MLELYSFSAISGAPADGGKLAGVHSVVVRNTMPLVILFGKVACFSMISKIKLPIA